MRMMNRTKMVEHGSVAVLALTLAVFGVLWNNHEYWQQEPYPGGQTAEEALEECPWLAPGIERLVRTYSIPLGVVFFLSLYGAFASLMYVRGPTKAVLATSFLWALLLFPVWFLFVPLFVGLFIAFGVLATARGDRRKLWFSAGAIAHNAVSAVVAWFFVRDWFAVFGD